MDECISIMEKYISDRVKAIDASGIRKVFALAAELKDPVNLSIGQPDFDVPEEIKEKAIQAIKDGFNKYSQTAGDAELLAKIKKVVEKQTGWQNPQALVASGVSGGLLLAFMAMINPGDEVIIPDPYFVIYKHLVNILGGKCVFINTYPDFRLPVEKIKKAITDKTKLIIVNSPCNPTGAVYTKNELKELAELAGKKQIPVLSDEIYEKFCYEGFCPSIAGFYKNTILLKGFSKAYAMPGWRLAYLAMPQHLKNLLEQMLKIQQYTFVCAPTPFQKAAITALDIDVTQHIKQYKIKRDIIYQGLCKKFELVKPQGAFYAFVKAPNEKATEFVKKAIENNVLIIPGNVFSEKDTHFRISFATSNDKLKKGVEILCSIA
jgi:aspartate aminotransferase/aminotransferase